MQRNRDYPPQNLELSSASASELNAIGERRTTAGSEIGGAFDDIRMQMNELDALVEQVLDLTAAVRGPIPESATRSDDRTTKAHDSVAPLTVELQIIADRLHTINKRLAFICASIRL